MFHGRTYECEIIKKAITSKRAELGIVYGRRRVGKSALLGQFLTDKGDLTFEGLEGVDGKKQIAHFADQLAQQTSTIPVRARNWKEAFEALTPHIATGKHYVVFDEFPWMASERSELVSILKFYWDRHWKNNTGLTLVLCGSIANFMVKHLVHSKALHNRKTFELKLDALPADEAQAFFKKHRSPFEMAKFLMIFGGIPKYLEQVDPADSLSVNMDRLCFQKNGFFVNEFETVFKEQFKVTATYEAIVEALSRSSRSKEEIAKILKTKPGGGLSTYLENLERADFTHRFSPLPLDSGFGRKTTKHVLWDEWLRFYFTYMKPHLHTIRTNKKRGLFEAITSSSLETYLGIAFERLCFKNLPNLLESLNIPDHEVIGYGPFFRQRSRNVKAKSKMEGLQIDALIHRKGQVLTLIECKFYSNTVGKSVIDTVERKIKLLHPPAKFSVEKVLIAANGVTPAVEDAGYFHKILGIEALFRSR